MELSTAGREEGEKENTAVLREVTLAPLPPLGPHSPSLTPRVKNIPLLYVVVGASIGAGKCSDSLRSVKRSSCSD